MLPAGPAPLRSAFAYAFGLRLSRTVKVEARPFPGLSPSLMFERPLRGEGREGDSLLSVLSVLCSCVGGPGSCPDG